VTGKSLTCFYNIGINNSGTQNTVKAEGKRRRLIQKQMEKPALNIDGFVINESFDDLFNVDGFDDDLAGVSVVPPLLLLLLLVYQVVLKLFKSY
jgi:hypothetical protein